MSERIDAEVRAGQLEVKVHCDSSQLDSALEKLDLLIKKAEQAQALGAVPDGTVLTASILGIAAASTTKRVSRRGLLGLEWAWPRR